MPTRAWPPWPSGPRSPALGRGADFRTLLPALENTEPFLPGAGHGQHCPHASWNNVSLVPKAAKRKAEISLCATCLHPSWGIPKAQHLLATIPRNCRGQFKGHFGKGQAARRVSCCYRTGTGRRRVCLRPACRMWVFYFVLERFHNTSPGILSVCLLKLGTVTKT